MSAQRSAQITLVNQTSQSLQFISDNLLHGIFGTTPPSSIPPNSSGPFEAESQGIATGVQGDVVYSLQAGSATLVTLNFDNPFVGTSSYTGNVNSTAFSLTVNVVDGGNNASVIYTLASS